MFWLPASVSEVVELRRRVDALEAGAAEHQAEIDELRAAVNDLQKPAAPAPAA